MTKLPLNWKRGGAQTEEYMKKPFFPLKGKKPLYMGKSCFLEGRSDTVALNISWPLDLARADPTAAIKSQYRYRQGTWGQGLIYAYGLGYSDR